MQDKIKYIIIGAAAFIVLIVMIFLGLKVRSLERERADLQGQNASLNEKISAMTADNDQLRQKVDALSKDIADVTAQRTDIQSKYDLMVQERDNLAKQIEQIKADQEIMVKQAAAGAVSGKPTMDDTYLASILKAKTNLEVQNSMMRDNLRAMKAVNDQLVLEKNNLSYQLDSLNRDTQEVQQSSSYNQKMVDNLTQELASEKTNNLDLTKRLKAAKEEARQQRQQIQSLAEKRLSLEKKVVDAQSKNASLESSLAGMELYVKQQMFQMDDIKDQMAAARPRKSGYGSSAGSALSSQDTDRQSRKEVIQLPPIVVRPQQAGSAEGPNLSDRTRIIAIDKENNFVVVNAGQGNNLKIGDMLQVFREGQNIGAVEVMQTRDQISACDIKDEATTLRVGDLIRL